MMDTAVYSLIEWIVEEPRERSYWAEFGHYMWLDEARRAAHAACREGQLLMIYDEEHIITVYHDDQEIWVVKDL